jgi:hypothetical protein
VQRCRNCGGANSDDGRFCEECGQELLGAAPAALAASQSPAAAVPQVAVLTQPAPAVAPSRTGQVMRSIPKVEGTHIALSEGERLWRSYPLVHFRPFRRRARGTLYVTDSRIILHSQARKTSGRTSLLEEVRIETVTGFGSHIDRGLGLFGTIVLIIWAIAGLRELFTGSAGFGLLMLVLTALVILVSYYYGRLGLRIYTNNSSPGPIGFGNFSVSRIQGLLGPLAVLGMMIGGVRASDVLYCFPEKDAEEVVSELGALVFDLNRQGTLAGTQWEADGV